MALDFPSSPTPGQVYGDYLWDGAKWVAASSGSSSTGAVRYDVPQALSVSQHAQANTNIAAASFDAQAYNGMQINGSMAVSQEKAATGTTVANTTAFILDGWKIASSAATGVVIGSQAALTTEVPGMKHCLQFATSVAQPTIGAATVRFMQYLEGYRFSRAAWGTSAAVPVTVGFWVRASQTGTYRAIMFNISSTTFTAWMPFTISSTSFEWKTITFAAQTTGTWPADNTTGAVLAVEMASAGTPNLLASTSDYASITGVIVLPGVQAPTAAQSPAVMRPYDQELVLCRRYLVVLRLQFLLIGTAYANARMDSITQWGIPMRSAPTMTYSNHTYFNSSGLTDNSSTVEQWRRFLTATAAGVCSVTGDVVADARL